MTDKELKHNLLAPIGVDFGEPGYILINPDGPAAWNRIEKLKAHIENLYTINEDLHLWKIVLDHQLVSAGCNTADSYSTPAEAIDALIKQEIALANDPLINEG